VWFGSFVGLGIFHGSCRRQLQHRPSQLSTPQTSPFNHTTTTTQQYADAERALIALISLPDLDAALQPGADAAAAAQAQQLLSAVDSAMRVAYGAPSFDNAAELAGGGGAEAAGRVAAFVAAAAPAAAFSVCDYLLRDRGTVGGADGGDDSTAAAHLFLQRLLYRINRLSHFW